MACENVIVNVYEQQTLPTQTQKETSNIGITVMLNMRK
jgi:hypothetical protein